MARNIRLYPWFQGARNLLFWQAIWFLFFQSKLSAAEAIALAALYDLATTVLEVPSGYLSDRFGRRPTLILSAIAAAAGAFLLGVGDGFLAFACAQMLLGAGSAFVSGTDTSLLYESLLAEGREEEIAKQEILAWRVSFSALALSAVVGGVLATWDSALPFFATGLASLLALWIAIEFREPDHQAAHTLSQPPTAQARMVLGYLRRRSLAWLFALAVGMYVFSHVPFVFGQPFILQAMERIGWANQSELVSGCVTAAMMLVSVAASWMALPLNKAVGTAWTLMFSLIIQIFLICVLMFAVHPAAVALLLLRMVPNSFAQPFLMSEIQPQLDSAHRATYLSMQSLCGRLLFAASLFGTSLLAPSDGLLPTDAMQTLLVGYASAGLLLLGALWLTRHALLHRDN